MKKLAVSIALALVVTSFGGVAVARQSAEPTPGSCTKEELADLRAAGDRFAAGCFLPGQLLAGLEGVQAELDPGQTDSTDNLELVGHAPLTGAFTAEGSFGTDLAFKGDYAFDGNYNGFTVYDISEPTKPRQVVQVVCPGAQNDISVYRNLLVLSVDSSRNNDSCDNEPQSAEEESSWEGIRIFDISNPKKPRYVAAVETDCGSHTHTLAPGRSNLNLFIYVSSYSPNASHPDCQPPHDFISIVKVPFSSPEKAKVSGTPVLFPDGGNSSTSGCHDVTAYPAKNLLAGACMGDGVLMDIKIRNRPRVLHTVTDENFSFWHSATFNNAGTKVVFTDELGGGQAPTCFGPTMQGADGIYDVEGAGDERQLAFKSYFKIPRIQGLTENCVAHNGSLIPVKGRDIMVQAWYQGGTSVWDFTDSANPVEIGWFDRGAISDTELVLGGSWSSYWYNGYIYSSDITRGLEVFEMNDPLVNGAKQIRLDRFNAQSQPPLFNG